MVSVDLFGDVSLEWMEFLPMKIHRQFPHFCKANHDG